MGGILFLYVATKKFLKLPNTLFLVIGSTILITFTNLTSLGVDLVVHIPSGLPALIIPDPNLIDVYVLLTLAVTVFLVSYKAVYLFAEEYAAKYRYKTRN